MKWKCKNGHILDSETKPEKCAECDSVEFEEVAESTNEAVEKLSNTIDDKRVANLEKKVDTLLEELKLEREARQNAEKDKEKAILETEKKYADAERLKEIEIEEQKQKELDEKANTLKVAKEKASEAEDWKRKYEQKEFETFKLKTSIEKPWLESILKKCDTKEKYEIMTDIINESELKTKYESEQNPNGSILNIPGGKSAEDAKPKTVSQILAERIKQKEQAILDKRRR